MASLSGAGTTTGVFALASLTGRMTSLEGATKLEQYGQCVPSCFRKHSAHESGRLATMVVAERAEEGGGLTSQVGSALANGGWCQESTGKVVVEAK